MGLAGLPSPTHSSTESVAMLTNANCLPSADQTGIPAQAPEGNLDVNLLAVGDVHQIEVARTARDAVSASACRACCDCPARRELPPARRNGLATRAIDGYSCHETSRIASLRRTHDRLRRRRRAHHIQNVFWRLVVSGGGISRLRHRHGLWGRWSSLRGSNNSDETDQQRSADRAAERVSNSHLFFPFCLDEIAWQTF